MKNISFFFFQRKYLAVVSIKTCRVLSVLSQNIILNVAIRGENLLNFINVIVDFAC